jgi:hypothetical protein
MIAEMQISSFTGGVQRERKDADAVSSVGWLMLNGRAPIFVLGSIGSADRAAGPRERCVAIGANQPRCSDDSNQNYSQHRVLCDVLAILGPEKRIAGAWRKILFLKKCVAPLYSHVEAGW